MIKLRIKIIMFDSRDQVKYPKGGGEFNISCSHIKNHVMKMIDATFLKYSNE